MRLSYGFRLCVIFSLCCFLMGSGASESNQSPTQNPNSNSSDDSKCSFKCEDFQALETRNGELEKSHVELKEQVKLLSQKFDELESKISEDDGVWLMKPPLRGPPGKQAEKGDKGEQGPIDPRSLKSCSDAMEFLPSPDSERRTIYPHGNNKSLEVLCDFEVDGGGWTLIQKRSSGPKQEFQKNWNEYVKGFGSLDGNFWLGLENIHALTKKGDQELRIELEDFEGNKAYAKYSSFSISDAADFYRLNMSGFSGTAGDSMTNPRYYARYSNNGMRFSTKDKDNDKWSGYDCVARMGGGGGWWFNHCGGSSLNGLYFEKGETVPLGKGIYWSNWKGHEYSLAKTEMKIRTRKS